MGTRSIIAYGNENEWEGIYCHWDGYPSGVGRTIWEIFQDKFMNIKDIGIGCGRGEKDKVFSLENKINTFVNIYIKGHKGGWSSFGDNCYCHNIEFVLRDGLNDSSVTNDDDQLEEWLYIIDSKTGKMLICDCPVTGGYKKVYEVDMADKNLDWDKIELDINKILNPEDYNDDEIEYEEIKDV